MNEIDFALLASIVADQGLMAIEETRLARSFAARAAAAPAAEAPATIALIPVSGMLLGRSVSSYFGTIAGQDALRARIATAAADSNVGSIVLYTDSPGGTVAGTAETAATVRQAAQVKPVVAVVDSIAASAAYWIISGASEIVLAPNAEVGSIGIMAMHLDQSRMMDRVGVTATIITSSQYKAERSPFAPLSEEARAALKASVDEADTSFVADVALGRRTTPAAVAADFGRGRMVGADQAVRLGMADRVSTLTETIARLAAGTGPQRRARRSALAFV